jgi:putative hemolysin
MDADDLVASLLIAIALLFAIAFFVAAEFAILTLRRRRVEQTADDGSISAFSAAERAEEISLAAQFGGIVLTFLLGYLVADVALALFGGLNGGVAIALGIALAASAHLVIAQQIPRFLGSQHTAWVNHPIVLGPLRAYSIILRPLTAVLSFVLEVISERLRLSRSAFYAPIYTLEDIRELVTQGHEQGVVEEDEREMIHGVFDFSETVAREVMTPRTDIVAVPLDASLDALLQVVVEEGHSRIPVYDGTIDNVVGILLAKDLLPMLGDPEWGRSRFNLAELMRPPYFVPDTKPVDDILARFRQSGVHLAIVIDEFGGTYGLVTLEDLLEEIVGEISDEYDVEEPEFAPTPEGDVLIDGGVAISEVNERFGLGISEADFDTIGGYVFGALGRVPIAGDRIDAVSQEESLVLQVEEVEDRRVTRVRLKRSAEIYAPKS